MYGNQVRIGGECTRNACEGQEWRLDNLAIKRAEKTREVLKGGEYTLKKRGFTLLAIRYTLYLKPQTWKL